MRFIDISQPLYQGMPVWPGDPEFSSQFIAMKEKGDASNVGCLQMSTHTGTHVDAPFHIQNEGQSISALDLDLFVGPARVIYLPEREKIGVEDIKSYSLKDVSRLLIRTDAWKDRTRFPKSFPCLEPEVATYLSEQGIRLIGVDLPSVDEVESHDLRAHHAFYNQNIIILEGLVLDQVEEGEYELIALPLKIRNGDASPVRAVLRVFHS